MSDTYNWCYHTGRRRAWAAACCTGRGALSGAARVRSMPWSTCAGTRGDYERWRRQGAAGWDFTRTAYPTAAERTELGAGRARGARAPARVPGQERPPAAPHAFLEAAQQAGYPLTEDMKRSFLPAGGARLDGRIMREGRCRAS